MISLKRLILLSLLGTFLCSDTITQTTIDSTFTLDSIDVFYKSDKYELTDSQLVTIKNLIESNDKEDILYHIESFADSDGSTDYNYKLAERRGTEIEKTILNLNLNDIPIRKIIHGEVSLGDGASGEKEKAFNRRSILKVVKEARYKNVNIKVLSRDSSALEDTELNVFFSGVKQDYKMPASNQLVVPLPLQEKIELHFISKDHFPIIKRLKLDEESELKDIRIPMRKMDLDSMMITKVQFEGGMSIVIDRFYKELQTLSYTLLKSSNICVEIAGHINLPFEKSVDRETDNFRLSIARSLEIQDYLVKQGISEDRLLSKGYGNHHMLFPFARSADEQSKNRRVEIKVISCDSSKLLTDDYLDEVAKKKFKFRGLPIDRKFNIITINEDLPNMSYKGKSDIVAQAKHLQSKGQDPKKFSYRELLLQYKARKETKAY